MSILTDIKAEQADFAERTLGDRLAQGIAAKLLPVFSDIHQEICVFPGGADTPASARHHAEHLAQYCAVQRGQIAELNVAERRFQTRLANAVDDAEERAAILDFARALGAGRKQIKSDSKAFGQWFDSDAVMERFHKRIGERERALAHAIERLGHIAGEAVASDPLFLDTAFFVELSDEVLSPMRNWRGDARIRQSVHSCLAAIAERVGHWPFGYWFEEVLAATRRVCLDESEEIWVQCAAFDALLALSPQSIPKAILARLKQPIADKSPQRADNELFLRRHLIRLVSLHCARDDAFADVLRKLSQDASGAVRQVVAEIADRLPAALAQECVLALRGDADAQVRASLFADVPRMLKIVPPMEYGQHIAHILKHEDDEFTLRIALDAACQLSQHIADSGADDDADGNPERVAVHAAIERAILAFQATVPSPKMLRWANEARERVWLSGDRQALTIARALAEITSGQREAQIRSAKALSPWLPEDSETIGRAMAVMAQNGFGLSLKTGSRPSVQVGEWIKGRLWRSLFEGGNSATDKRQAHIHTTGRHYHGTLLAPSARMAELAPTKVPGEPLVESSEGGWRNYLPLLDQVLASLDSGKTLELFTSAGVTEISPPSGIWRRLRIFLKISRRFAELANLRNRDPAQFLEELGEFGVTVSFRPYEGEKAANPHVAQYFEDGGTS